VRISDSSRHTNAISGSVALESGAEIQLDELETPDSASWKMMASAAAGTLLGMPFVSSGTFRAAWLEVLRWITALQK